MRHSWQKEGNLNKRCRYCGVLQRWDMWERIWWYDDPKTGSTSRFPPKCILHNVTAVTWKGR
jgi:hypothetical protein